MEYGYEKLLKEHNINVADLPKDAQIGIKSLKQLAGAIATNEKAGRPVSQEILDKIKANDKWVIREILDYVEEKEIDRGEIPNDPKEIIEEIEEEAEAHEAENDDPNLELGLAIEAELEAQYKAGIKEITLAEIKSKCPKAYETIFKTYEPNGSNGVRTSKFSLIENTEKPETFNLQAI